MIFQRGARSVPIRRKLFVRCGAYFFLLSMSCVCHGTRGCVVPWARCEDVKNRSWLHPLELRRDACGQPRRRCPQWQLVYVASMLGVRAVSCVWRVSGRHPALTMATPRRVLGPMAIARAASLRILPRACRSPSCQAGPLSLNWHRLLGKANFRRYLLLNLNLGQDTRVPGPFRLVPEV